MSNDLTTEANLSADLVEVLNRYRQTEKLSYATVIGVFELLKDMLLRELDELEDELDEQDFDNDSIFKSPTRTSNESSAGRDIKPGRSMPRSPFSDPP